MHDTVAQWFAKNALRALGRARACGIGRIKIWSRSGRERCWPLTAQGLPLASAQQSARSSVWCFPLSSSRYCHGSRCLKSSATVWSRDWPSLAFTYFRLGASTVSGGKIVEWQHSEVDWQRTACTWSWAQTTASLTATAPTWTRLHSFAVWAPSLSRITLQLRVNRPRFTNVHSGVGTSSTCGDGDNGARTLVVARPYLCELSGGCCRR